MAGVTQTIFAVLACCPDVRPGVVGKGTSLEGSMYHLAGKPFLYVRSIGQKVELRLKLGPSVPDAKSLAVAQPSQCHIDEHAWVTLLLPSPTSEAPAWLGKWIEESYAMLTSSPQ